MSILASEVYYVKTKNTVTKCGNRTTVLGFQVQHAPFIFRGREYSEVLKLTVSKYANFSFRAGVVWSTENQIVPTSLTIFLSGEGGSGFSEPTFQRGSLCKIWTQIYCVKFTVQQTCWCITVMSWKIKNTTIFHMTNIRPYTDDLQTTYQRNFSIQKHATIHSICCFRWQVSVIKILKISIHTNFCGNYRPHTKYGGRYCFHRYVSFILSTGGGGAVCLARGCLVRERVGVWSGGDGCLARGGVWRGGGVVSGQGVGVWSLGGGGWFVLLKCILVCLVIVSKWHSMSHGLLCL